MIAMAANRQTAKIFFFAHCRWVFFTLGPYGYTVVHLKCCCRKPFGTDVICILRSQQESQAICNSQCKQTEGLFKDSDFDIIGKEMEAELS